MPTSTHIPEPPAVPAQPGDASSTARFPVVGIGASAGGLPALRELLENLPPDTGLAYVVVPHLAPNHPSIMADILAQSTAMPVAEVTSAEVAVEPDHVYVLAPNTLLTLVDGHLRVLGDAERAERRACIDHFFVSLARSHQERAVGVVLSGSASDGTEGIRAVKAAGGITFAQDESAAFPEMPRNAAGSGCVDFVLSPRGIAEEIVRIVRHPTLGAPSLAPGPGAPPVEDETLPILRLLHGATGVDFTLYKQSTIRRRMARRMALQRIDTVPAYLAWLEDHPAEVRALHDDILINVTSFFRDPEVFEVLKERVFPQIVKDRSPDGAVRIWVPGCSTGEEAYSLAIALLEFFEDHRSTRPAQIFGTDVSEAAVERARHGVYDASIEAEVSPERLRRFFVRSPKGEYQVAKTIRDLCVFARQDLARDPPFSRLDLLSCRNVLIYLGAGLQRRVMPMFHYALKPSGFLLLGPAESVGAFGHLFSVVDKPHNLYAKLAAAPQRPFDLGMPAPRLPVAARLDTDAGPEFEVGREADRLLLAHFVPAAIVIDGTGQILHVRGETGPFLRPAPGKPSLHLSKMVREDLLMDLENAVREAREKGRTIRRVGIPLRGRDGWRDASIEVSLLRRPASADVYYLVLFQEAAHPGEARPSAEQVETQTVERAGELGQRLLLGQVLVNLIRNALTFIAPGVAPQVRIRTEERQGTTRVWVEDNGIGIPARYQDRVFGVFERLHSADAYPGAGIGLAIVRRAVERMGGTVGVESEEGKGSRFWFELQRGEET